MINSGLILIIDDTPTNAKMLESMLKRNNFTPATASSGREGLAMIAEAPPELIILDIMMPEMDGFEVCRRLKADPKTADIPIIFISAMNETESIVTAFDIGGVDYITKPFQLREVQKRVESHLTLIRQRREIEALREQERQQFETINSMREKFIHAATHDLKNPLQLITGYTEVLRSDETFQSNPGLNYYLDAMRGGVQKILGLVGDMLDLIQMENSIDPSPELTDLHTFVDGTIKQYELPAQQKNIELLTDLPPQEVIANIDAKRMRQVLDNLVSNAIKYTPDDGHVMVSAFVEDSMLILKVSDTGLGIPEEYIDTLFQPFARVREREHMKQEGTGLGLSIVKTIIEQHHGDIEIESTAGEGTSFIITLPDVIHDPFA
ncbi:MAG: hybrid sensor histidine kinase/response regulator [Aggregatilineales bacterium]